MQFLEEQIKSREGYTEGTQSAVKNLEMHHVAGVTDLRGRVARCDAAIARLSSDLKTCYDSIKAMNQQQQDGQQRMTEKLQSLEVKVGNSLTIKYRYSKDIFLTPCRQAIWWVA